MNNREREDEVKRLLDDNCPRCPVCNALSTFDEYGFWCKMCYNGTIYNPDGRIKTKSTPDIPGSAEQQHLLARYQAHIALRRTFGEP